MNHGVEQCTLSNHPAHTLPQAMISEKKNRKITSKFLKTVLMNLHEQICFLKDKSIKVNNSDRTKGKLKKKNVAKIFVNGIFSQCLEVISYFWQCLTGYEVSLK